MKNLAVILLIIVFCLCLVFLLVCGGVLLQQRVFGRNLHYHPFFMGLLLIPWAIVSNMSRTKLGLLKRNFKGRPVMAAYGLDLFGYILLLAALKTIFQPAAVSGHVVMSYVAAMGGMWALGLIDDIYGDRGAKGVRGHFRELFLHGKLTTGALKAIGGLVLGFVLGVAINGDLTVIISSVLLIPLSANAVNLMDLRPGRACGVFLLAMFVCMVAFGFLHNSGDPFVLMAMMAVAVTWLYVDAPGSSMMGDSGSNMLGAFLGTYLLFNGTPANRLIAIVALVALSVYAEKRSISDLVESKPWLRTLDSQLGVR